MIFDRISIQHLRSGDAANPLELGFLGETMLFYDTVEIAANRAVLQQLIREIGPKLLLKFLKRQYLRIRFEPNFEGIVTENAETPLERHGPTVAQIEGQDLFEVLEPMLHASVGRLRKAERLASHLAAHIENRTIDADLAVRAADDFRSRSYVREAVNRMLRVYTPDALPRSTIRFDMIPVTENRFRVSTNLDFKVLNKSYHQRISPSHSSLSPAYLLSHLLTARKMLEDGANSNSEIAAAPVYRELIAAKVKTAFQKRDSNAAHIDAFQRLVFEAGRSLSGVLACKERSFRDLLKVPRRAKKFRGWLQTQSPNQELIKSYFESVTKGSWIDKLPTKTVRWSFFTGAGFVADHAGAGGWGTLTGVALSAGDAFLLDKLLKGWNPNQFVDETLQNFVGGNGKR